MKLLIKLHFVIIAIGLCFLLEIAGCSDKSNLEKVCESGETQQCNCPDGSIGTQSCKDDNSGWNDCECDSDSNSSSDSDSYDNTDKNWIVPPTGQNKCYNNTSEITCPDKTGSSSCAKTDFCGQDTQYSTKRTFTVTTVNGKNMVKDSATELIWAQEFESGKTWQQAINYCYDLNYGGHTNWRLPSPTELTTITNLDAYDPAIDTTAFPDVSINWFWSSLPSAHPYAWYVCFDLGSVDSYVKDYSNGARCVRGRPLKIGSFEPLVISSDRVVKDLGTGLMWQGCAAGQSKEDCLETATNMNWKDALSYCEGLTWADHDDWRLPNAHELQSIINYKECQSIDKTAFPNTPEAWFWSSSSYVNLASYAWGVEFANGGVTLHIKTNNNLTRCVRSGP